MKLVIKILTFAFIAFIAIQFLVYFLQERLIFFPMKLPADFRFRLGQPFVEVSIPTDGAVLHALRFRVRDPKGIIVYFHGNSGSLEDWGSVGDSLSHFGYDVLISDYRGFGKSTGKLTSEAQLMADSRTILDLARKEYPDSKITLFGRSLGSGIATQLAASMDAKLLILESPYLSVQSRATAMFPFVLPFVLKYPLRSDLFAPKVTAPVLLIHGTEDEVIPYSSGEALTHRFTKPPTFVTLEGGHHNDLSEFPEYRAALERALGK